jgi:hypothetical protein
MSDKLVCNLMAYEKITPQVVITLSSEIPFDLVKARKAIKIAKHRLGVSLSKDGYTLEIRAKKGFKPGPHELAIGELPSIKGKSLNDPYKIPFTVVATQLKLPEDLQIEHWVRLRIEEYRTQRLPIDTIPDGPFVDVIKANEWESNRPVDLAFNEQGQEVDFKDLMVQLEQRREERFGRIHEALFNHMETATEPIPVAIWLKIPNFTYPDKPLDGPVNEPPEEELKLREEIQQQTAAFQEQLSKLVEGSEGTVDSLAPVVYTSLTPEQINEVAQLPEVTRIFLHETEGTDDIRGSMELSHCNEVHLLRPPINGNRIKVAVWERADGDHAKRVQAVIQTGSGDPRGYAPACTIRPITGGGADLGVIATDNCTVVNQSFNFPTEATIGERSVRDIYFDFISLTFPYPMIVQAAGNDPSEFVNHKGFNCLVVGGQQSEDVIYSDSTFLNPMSSRGDRELPEIVAKSVNIKVLDLPEADGTSFAAPAVAGSAALIQQKDSILKSWPEGCRAILLASARSMETTWWDNVSRSVDIKTGSGGLDVLEAINITDFRQQPNSAVGFWRGWDVQNVKRSDFDAITRLCRFSYQVQVPDTNQATGESRGKPIRIKAAIAWNAWLQTSTSSFFTLNDLDLQLYLGNQLVANSSSYDNSYEIIEWYDITPGQTYKLKVRFKDQFQDFPESDKSRLGIAWTVF